MQPLLLDIDEAERVCRCFIVRSFAQSAVDVQIWLRDRPFRYSGHISVRWCPNEGEEPLPTAGEEGGCFVGGQVGRERNSGGGL